MADSQSNNLPELFCAHLGNSEEVHEISFAQQWQGWSYYVTYTSVWTYIFAANSPASWVQAEQLAHVPQAGDEGMKGPEAAAIKRAMA